MSIENLINRAFNIEEKAIRKVRTVEGSRMYGQPIGTIITRDMIERAKRKRARDKAKNKRGNGSSDRTVNRSQSAEPSISSASTAKKPIPEDFSEPGLPGMGKFKSKAESNKKRYMKLFAKMGEDSLVYDERNKKTYRRIVDDDYKKEPEEWTRVWIEDGTDEEKEYTDEELADIVKGQPDISYEHINDDGEYVESHQSQTFTAGGTTQPVEKRPTARKKPSSPKESDNSGKQNTGKQNAGTKKPVEKREAGLASDYTADKIKKNVDLKAGDQIFAGSRVLTIKEAKKDGSNVKLSFVEEGAGDVTVRGGDNTTQTVRPKTDDEKNSRDVSADNLKAGDKIKRNGKWNTVASVTGKGDETEIEFDNGVKISVTSGSRFDTLVAKGEEKKPTPKREPGTSLFGGYKKPADDEGSSSTTTSNTRDTSKEESPDGYEEGAIGNASNLKPGDKVFDTVYRNGKSSKVVLTVESTDRRKNNGKSYTYSVKFTNGTGNSGTIGVTRYTRAIPKDSNTSGTENSGSGNDSGSSTESTPPKKVVPAPDKFADSNDVNIEPRPLTGDEISKRAVKYEEEALAQIKKYRESRGSKYSFSSNEGQRGYTPTEEEFNKLEAFPSNKTPESLDDFSWAKATHIADVEFARWGSLTLVRKSAGKSDEKLFLKFGSGYVTEYANFIDHRGGRPTVKDKATLSHIKENYGDWLDRDLPKRVKRTETPFWDYWNGIRGIDWMADEENDDDYKSKEAFKRKNDEESKRLGVVVKGNFNPEQHAVLNSVLETYQERYPGLLSKNIGGFGIVGGTNSFVAGFHANVNMGRSLKGSIGKEPMGTGANRLSFNSSYFSDNGSASTDKWIGLERGAMMTGHFVGGDRVDIAEKMGLKPDHVHAMYTTNHEIGHAIGSWIFGETGVDDVRGREQRRTNPGRAKDIAKRYSDKVSKVFQQFGIMDDNTQLSDHVDTTSSTDLNDGMMARLKRLKVVNQTALSAHLSAYGATNLHEVMAETWASYSMDEQPTEFALELGEIMEDLLLELSEESGLVPSEEKGISLRDTLMNKLYALSNG